MEYVQGRFSPTNPSRYKGDPTKIIFRSSWELVLMKRLDTDPHIIWWQSEEITIPYRSPVDGRIHRYFPDFLVKTSVNGIERVMMIEIKPKKETQPPKPPKKKKSRRYVEEVMKYGVNMKKWEAAEEYCLDRGWKFEIMTEENLFPGKL